MAGLRLPVHTCAGARQADCGCLDPTQSSRKTVLWFAKDWNYLLVRLHQVEKDGKEYQIMLKDGQVDGRTVEGLAE